MSYKNSKIKNIKIISSSILISILLSSYDYSNAQQICGDIQKPCTVNNGQYYVKLPQNHNQNTPMVIFLHGAGGTGKTVMGNKNLVNGVTDRGYVFVAPTGGPRENSRFKNLWNFYPEFKNMRDDKQFIKNVRDDVVNKFKVNKKVMLSGFSAGAFMVTYLACDKPKSFNAYAPVAGGFWLPHPKKCKGPVRLLQTHGWNDKTVPLEGRSLGGGRYHQGDIFQGLQIWRDANQCNANPKTINSGGEYWQRKWDCKNGALELVMHKGSHTLPKEWADMALDWFEGLNPNN